MNPRVTVTRLVAVTREEKRTKTSGQQTIDEIDPRALSQSCKRALTFRTSWMMYTFLCHSYNYRIDVLRLLGNGEHTRSNRVILFNGHLIRCRIVQQHPMSYIYVDGRKLGLLRGIAQSTESAEKLNVWHFIGCSCAQSSVKTNRDHIFQTGPNY